MNLRISGITKESVVDGPGYRFVLFTQGCLHRCPGCHNSTTWDLSGGYTINTGDVLKQVKSNKLLRGVTFSGGEPFLQCQPLAQLGQETKELGLDVLVYTGYTWEDLIGKASYDNKVRALIDSSDYIIDGPFILAKRDLSLQFRGSSNQRMIDVSKSLQEGKAIAIDFA